ncbi:MAG: FHA domain-containing protein [Lachnospiraceae bacterium]|nr:FHA domain-containing protein [Lachnospiraceae bacterium]
MEDLNSRNGCSINEINLESYEKVELSSGDRIRIGSVDFIYN